jgi:type II secretory pathway pseudopilin PulG
MSGKTLSMRLRPPQSKFSLSNTGDTIVEVLIAIAIVSSVLAGAFTVTQKSSQAVRSSQERAEMLQILQGQVELVRAIAVGDVGNTADVFGGSGAFCIDAVAKTRLPYTGGSTLPASDMSTVHAKCKNIASLYNIGITYDGLSHTFTFVGWWDKLGGGMNTMRLTYKIAPAS